MTFTPNPSEFNTRFSPEKLGDDWEIVLLPIIASVAMGQGAAIYYVGNGTTTIVTDSTANFAGILLEEILATDADFATSMKMKRVAVPKSQNAQCKFTVGAGTFTTADVGKSVEFNDSVSLAVDTAGTQARITNYLTETRGVCVFNIAIS